MGGVTEPLSASRKTENAGPPDEDVFEPAGTHAPPELEEALAELMLATEEADPLMDVAPDDDAEEAEPDVESPLLLEDATVVDWPPDAADETLEAMDELWAEDAEGDTAEEDAAALEAAEEPALETWPAEEDSVDADDCDDDKSEDTINDEELPPERDGADDDELELGMPVPASDGPGPTPHTPSKRQ